MAVLHWNREEFEAGIAQGGLVMVDFWATWCSPCRMIAPVLEELAAEREGEVVIAKVDTDSEPELCMRYGIQSIPNVILFRDGNPVKQLIGAQPKQAYRKAIEEA